MAKKSELKAPTSKKEQLEILKNDVNKRYSDGALTTADEVVNIFTLRRPTGIPTLDEAIGGGFPAGGITELIGAEGATKTVLTNYVCKGVQDTYGDDANIAACMSELSLDKALARKCDFVVPFSDIEINMFKKSNKEKGLPDFTEEQMVWLKQTKGNVLHATYPVAESLLDVSCDLIASNLFPIVLIDSIGALYTTAEQNNEEGFSKNVSMGNKPKLINRFVQKATSSLVVSDANGRPNTTSIIAINQYRENMNAGLYGNPLLITGGCGLKHGKFLSILLKSGKPIVIEQDKVKIKVGKTIYWEIIKGKAGCHEGTKGEYDFYFGIEGFPFGIDVIKDFVVLAIEKGIIEQAGAWFSCGGERLGQGLDNVKNYLRDNPKHLANIKADVDKKSDKQYITKEDF